MGMKIRTMSFFSVGYIFGVLKSNEHPRIKSIHQKVLCDITRFEALPIMVMIGNLLIVLQQSQH